MTEQLTLRTVMSLHSKIPGTEQAGAFFFAEVRCIVPGLQIQVL
jgi:hypothetical protein